jgi:ABC transporter DrrB family efflux protein
MTSFSQTISDILVMVRRNLLKYERLPRLIVFSFIQPVMFVLLFAYVFGGAIKTPGVNYINYLLPGIIVQTVVFGAMQTGVGLAEDITHGMIDRFRSLPMARSAVLAGRTIAESIRNFFVILIMIIVGYIIGFRIEHGILSFTYGILLTVLFGFAFSWISAAVGMAVKDVETAQSAGFVWIFPLVFASSIFVPTSTLSGAIKVFAEHNPITYTVNVVRDLSLGLPVGDNIWYSLAWIFAILIVFVPLAVNRYRQIK